MKKVFSLFSFAVLMMAMCMTVSSCGDDDDDDKSDKNVKIEGNWLVMSSRGSDTEKWEDMSESVSWVWSFGTDGTYRMILNGKVASSATYKVEGTTVTITFKDNSYQTMHVYNLYSGKMEADVGLYGSNGKLVNFYHIVRCPATADEAKEMLMAQWKYETEEVVYADEDYDEFYMDLSKDGKEYDFYHYKKYLPSDNEYYEYRGKYVCLSYKLIFDVTIAPDEKNPTKGKIYAVNEYYGTETYNFGSSDISSDIMMI